MKLRIKEYITTSKDGSKVLEREEHLQYKDWLLGWTPVERDVVELKSFK